MSEFFFVLKTLIFSVLVMLALQMKFSGVTLEERTESMIYRSNLGPQLQLVAKGAIRAGKEGYAWTSQKVAGFSQSDSTKRNGAEVSSKRTSHSTPKSEDSRSQESWEHDLD